MNEGGDQPRSSLLRTHLGLIMKRKKLAWNCLLSVVGLLFFGVYAEAQSLKFSKDSLTFDAQAVGTSSSAIQITLSNVDDKNPLKITRVSTGDTPGDFALSDNQCEKSLDPSRTCSVSVTFRPTALGTRSGKLTVTSNAANNPPGIELSGVGRPAVAADPPSIQDFTDRDLDTISDAKMITLKTSSLTPVSIGGIGVSDNFILRDNNCQTAIPAGVDGCQISVAFRPIHTGDVSGTATVAGTDGKPLVTIVLRGKGLSPNDCGLTRTSGSWRDVVSEFAYPVILAGLFFVGIVLVRWNMIAHPTQRLLEAQIAAVESRLSIVPAVGSASPRKDAIGKLLETARGVLRKRANPFDWIFWSRGHEMSGWGCVHDAEEQLATLLPAEQVRARLESSQAHLRKLNTPVANAIADTVRSVLGEWSPAADCSSNAIHHALGFLASQSSLAQSAGQAPATPPLAGDPFSALPSEVANSWAPKATNLLEEIDQCLGATPAPPEPRLSALTQFRTALAPQIPLLEGAAQQVIAKSAAIAAQTAPAPPNPPAANDAAREPWAAAWKAFTAALSNFANARAGWSQGLSDALVAEKTPVERGRALLQEALQVIYDSTDTELSVYASWHNKGLWLSGCALLLIVPLAGLFQNGVLFLVGGLGGLLSRLSRELKRAEFPTDYGASWMTLFLSPVVGALTGWAGVLLVSILKDFGIVGNALKVDWCKPYAPLSLGLAVAFGFSERLFDTVISQLEDRVASQGAKATSTGPASLKIATTKVKDGKAHEDYGKVQLEASGGTPPYAWSITSGQLPQGLKMDPTGAITGTATTEGTFSISVQVTDKDSKTDSQKLTLNVTK